MLTATLDTGTRQLPKTESRIKPKTIILGVSLVLGILFYSQSRQPKLIELSATKQSPSYTKLVEQLADSYQLIAESSTVTPGNSCYKRSVNDCLELLKPDKPIYLNSLEPESLIKSDLQQLGYQARIDAINFAQEKVKNSKQNTQFI